MPNITTLLSHPDKATEREIAKYYAAPFNMEELYQRSLAKARGEAAPQKKAAPSIYRSTAFRAVTAAACLLLTVGLATGVWAKLQRIEPIPPEDPTDMPTAVSETEPSVTEPSGSESAPVIIVPGETSPSTEAPTEAPQPLTDPTEPPADTDATSAPTANTTQPATVKPTERVQPTQRPTGPAQDPTEPCIETQSPTQRPISPTEAWDPTEACDITECCPTKWVSPTECPTEAPIEYPTECPTEEPAGGDPRPTEAETEPTEGAFVLDDSLPGFRAVWNRGNVYLTYSGSTDPSPDRYILYELTWPRCDVSHYTEEGTLKYRISMPTGNVCYVKQIRREVYQIIESWHSSIASVEGYDATILIRYNNTYKLFWDDGYYTFCATGDNTDELLDIRSHFRQNPDGISV